MKPTTQLVTLANIGKFARQQRLHGLGAEYQAKDKAPDGQQDEEEPIARKAHDEPEEDADKTGTGQGEERFINHGCFLL